jgi:8-oxo-dGTP pyrophosphatase MutT (NUDIX family)
MVADLQRFDASGLLCRGFLSTPGLESLRPAVYPGVAMPEERRANGWRIVRSEIVIDSPHLRLRRDDIVLPDGTRVDDYFVRESLGFSVIFAITPDRRVVLVRQYKHGIGRSVVELPAGAIDPGESSESCARRELAEETGYVCAPEHLEPVASFVTDPTNSNAHFELFLARDVQPSVAQELDATEDIEVRLASFEELRRFVCDGTIEVSSHVAAIYFMLDRLGEL